MSRPRNGILCPECRKAGREVVCEVVKTIPGVGSGTSRVYFCPDCGGMVRTHEEVTQYTPPVLSDAPKHQAPA